MANRYEIHQVSHMLEELPNEALHRTPFPLSSKDAGELNVSKLINPAKVEMIVKRSFKLGLLITLLFAVASGFSQEAQTDSTRVERPKFSMTPT